MKFKSVLKAGDFCAPKSWMPMLLTTSLLLVSTNLLASQAGSVISSETSSSVNDVEALVRQVQNQTLRLSKSMRDKAAESAAVDIAKARHQGLLRLAELSPSDVVNMKIPNRGSVTSKIKPYLLDRKKLTGAVEVIYEDDANNGIAQVQYRLMQNGRKFVIKPTLPGQLKGLTTDQHIEISGLHLPVDDSESYLLLEQGDTAQTSQLVTPQGASITLGEQKTLVMLINFQDNAEVKPWSVEETSDLVFNRVDAFIRENSYGKTWLTGEVLDFTTLPIAQTCDSWVIYTASREALSTQGIDVYDFDKIIYIFPENSACGWTGKGTLGGNPGRTYINGSFTLNTVGHELGHNLGLQHANAFECGDFAIAENCLNLSYGDKVDIMGAFGNEGHFNAFNKEILGWSKDDAASVESVNTSGTYFISPLASQQASGSKGLKVLRHLTATGEQYWYYLEYRRAEGFDQFIADTPALSNGVLVHYASDSDISSSRYLDMTPASGFYDWNDAALSIGQSYTDMEAGVVIEPVEITPDGIWVNVQVSQELCVASAPTLTITEPVSWGAAGNAQTYQLTVTNNDSDSCPQTDFALSAAVPVAWSADNAILSLLPGESKTATITVFSADDAEDGFYTISFSAENAVSQEYIATQEATFVVESPQLQCQAVDPVLHLQSQSAQTVAPGETIDFQGLLENQDSLECDASLYNITANLPDGWLVSEQQVQLAPQQSQPVTVTITSPQIAQTDTYNVTLVAEVANKTESAAMADAIFGIDRTLACELRQPELNLLSDAIQSGISGETLTYQFSLLNHNSLDCESQAFLIDAGLPEGWSTTAQQLTLASGESQEFILNITSPASVNAADYALPINATNVQNTAQFAQQSVTYRVLAMENAAPVAEDDIVIITDKSAVDIDVLANDFDPDGDLLTLVSVSPGAKGSVSITTDGKVYYVPAKSFKNSDSFTYVVTDGELQISATVTIQLQSDESSSGGKGGKGGGKGAKG
ncbi:Ig-like domain-containing protein [Thalassotalea mangrovi]|uniref:Peptidase M11 n=1 Tax=Thalassotalea mangrovi TaxID=2572245 RepID=A0A4U1B2E2_9GAMM|nr:Ig-like domain-containing protein [Thalassotalea mangrovi]TKB43201.1 hypothetical protein E8M12_15720 [Thalassotalea mangrovi]